MNSCIYDSPIGKLRVCEENGAITQLYIQSEEAVTGEETTACTEVSAVLKEACRQLSQYFAGKRKQFDLPLCLKGTFFQQKVWQALQEIPHGETRSYHDIAVAIGNPKAVRAIGGANHNNPVMIIVPCHRVINKDGSLGGFGGGVDVKRYLLELEK